MTEVAKIANNQARVAILPTQPYEITPLNPGEPSALQRLAALAAAAAAHDRDDDSDSNSEFDSDYSNSNTDSDIDDSDFVTFSLPFRMRRSSLPAALEGQKLSEVAKSAVRKIWSRRMANRSICH